MDKFYGITIHNKDGIIGHAKVSEDDYDTVCVIRWCLDQNGYVSSSIGRMHRVIMEAKDGEIIDHINNDHLDNTRTNLRIVTHSQNSQNKAKRKTQVLII